MPHGNMCALCLLSHVARGHQEWHRMKDRRMTVDKLVDCAKLWALESWNGRSLDGALPETWEPQSYVTSVVAPHDGNSQGKMRSATSRANYSITFTYKFLLLPLSVGPVVESIVGAMNWWPEQGATHIRLGMLTY